MMERMNGLSLEFIIHPGGTLKEVLEENNMSQEELAIRTEFSPKHISEVVNGKKGISSKLAKNLERVFNMPMSFWINLQGIYDKEILKYKEQENIGIEEIKIVKKLKKILKYAAENNLIEGLGEDTYNVIQARNLCGINNLENIKFLPMNQVAFRSAKSIDVETLYVWIRINELIAKQTQLKNDYNLEKLKANIQKIKSTMVLEINEAIEKLKEIFAECGIIFQISKSFTGAPVQGVIKKLNNKVMLTMTIRGAFADIFWFTLFHEIGHLINEDFNVQLIDYVSSSTEKEDKADRFARNILIDEKEFNEFLNNKIFSPKTVEDIAKKNNVPPFIIVGRLEKELNDYALLSEMRAVYKWEK